MGWFCVGSIDGSRGAVKWAGRGWVGARGSGDIQLLLAMIQSRYRLTYPARLPNLLRCANAAVRRELSYLGGNTK